MTADLDHLAEPDRPVPSVQPDWNDDDSVRTALDALRDARDQSGADEACDRFLWAVGDNQRGTFHPVAAAVMPELARLLESGSPWCQRAVMESLIDLAGTFVPAEGHVSVQGQIRASVRALRPLVAPLAHADDARARSATELLELIDDLAGMA